MTRYDQLEANIVEIIRRHSELGDNASLFTRREPLHGQRNLGQMPIIECEASGRDRESLTGQTDMETIQVVIRVTTSAESDKAKPQFGTSNTAMPQIIKALKTVPNLNYPVDIGALNDWTYTSTLSRQGELEILEITLSVQIEIPTEEV